MQQIEKVQVPGIETALWNFSLPELTAQTESIIHFPFINYASVHDKGRTITEAGRKKTRSFLNKEIPLYHEEGGQRTPIGTLSIQADSTGVWTLVIEQINPVLFFQALNVVIVIFIFLVLVDNQVTRHLLAAANYFLTFDIKDLGVPLKLDKKPANDEIDSLVAALTGCGKTSRMLTASRMKASASILPCWRTCRAWPSAVRAMRIGPWSWPARAAWD